MAFTEKTLTCRDCSTEFVFTVGEQEFFQSRGLLNDPGRCPECRAARRRERQTRTERQYFDIICDSCGAEAKVPFQPIHDRPVYCNECFTRIREERQ